MSVKFSLAVVILLVLSCCRAGGPQSVTLVPPEIELGPDGKSGTVVLVSVEIDSLGHPSGGEVVATAPESLSAIALDAVSAVTFAAPTAEAGSASVRMLVPVFFDFSTSPAPGEPVARVGDPVLMAASDLLKFPELLTPVRPDYPKEARLRALGGEVWVRMLVDSQGTVSRADVLRSSDEIFNEAALAAARKYRFRPGSYKGQPITLYVVQPFKFSLH